VAEPARAVEPEFKPHLFGKFYLLQRLAVGGMAEIYRAKVVGAAGFEKELALKRILPARSQDRGFIAMLVNEAKLTAQLTHSNIAQIYECGAVDGTYFIAMELVHGVSLKEVMSSFARGGVTLTPEQAIYIVLQLLTGLDYAHRKSDAEGKPLAIVHCDVSPDNALVSWEGEVKLLDFGIARAATGLSNYKEGMLMGKLGYVAPEQASIEKTWDHRVDLFAAGIILYELLTKQKPFPKATDVESLVAARKAKVTPPSALDDRIPKDLDVILARALAYEPEERYPTARAFADALVDVLFPTPHSAVQDMLGHQMKRVFGERIGRQRAARAHDALVMKVLQHVGEKPAPEAATPPSPAPVQLDLARDERALRPRDARKPSPPQRRGGSRSRALTAALLLLAAGGAAGFAGHAYLRPGVLIVTADPPGAQVMLEGRGATAAPAVFEGLPPGEAFTVVVSAPDRKSVTLALQPELGRAVRRVHAQLPLALGAVTIESDPPGAQVQIDDRPAGVTPLTIQDVRLDERHRVDLALAGHELDQFVVLPERDGQRFRRALAPVERRRAKARDPE
jgi:hypothetical protein